MQAKSHVATHGELRRAVRRLEPCDDHGKRSLAY
jgi:hypothetical protein